MSVITTQEGQTPLNIAVQYYGDIEQLFTLLKDNNLNADDGLIIGSELSIRDVNKKRVVSDYFQLKGVTVGNSENLKEVLKGIGTLEIGSSFIVG